MALKAPRSFAFVPIDDLGRPNGNDRKLIRSHCMRGKNGKNKIAGSHVLSHSLPKANYEALQAARSPLLYFSAQVPPQDHRQPPPPPLDDGKGIDNAIKDKEETEAKKVLSKIPPAPPGDLLLFKFAREVDRPSRELLFKYFTIARDLVYPAEICINYDPSRALWFQWLSSDAAYLHSVLLCTSFIQDFIKHSRPATDTYRHLGKTLKILNERLSDRSVSLQDSTFATVITLAQGYDFLGDYAASRAQIAGLVLMIRLRGGLEAFRGNSKLHIKLRHNDIVFALKTGEEPHFFPDSTYPALTVYGRPAFFDDDGDDGDANSQSSRMQSLNSLTDQRLSTIFTELQRFTSILRGTSGTKRRLRDCEFSNIVCSIQYRLLQLRGQLEQILDESIRLTMLAFLTTVTRVPGKDRFPYLTRRLRECICAVEAASPQLQDLVLWMLTVGALSVFDLDEVWLRERWQVHVPPQLTWLEALRRLKEIVWIEGLHDEAGKSVFEAMTSMEAPVSSGLAGWSEDRPVLPHSGFIQVAMDGVKVMGR